MSKFVRYGRKDLGVELEAARLENKPPPSATAIASSQARRRPVSPMLIQSEIAPIVQKLVLFATARMIIAMANADASTAWWR